MYYSHDNMRNISVIYYYNNERNIYYYNQLPTWPVAQLVEHRTSKPKVAGSNPSQAK